MIEQQDIEDIIDILDSTSEQVDYSEDRVDELILALEVQQEFEEITEQVITEATS